jgi:threonine/homoserine/homoserine lactone efflux protein
METLALLLTVAAVTLAGAASPGPGFLALVRAAAARGRGAGLRTAAGLVSGSVVWACAALFGLGLLFELAPWLQTALRLAGAAYLAWLALSLWRGAARPPAEAPEPARRPFRAALLLQLSNPKAAVFFGSVFVTVLPAQAPAALALAILATVPAVEFLWFSALALAFSTAPVRARYARLRGAIDRICGGLMAALAARLAWAG